MSVTAVKSIEVAGRPCATRYCANAFMNVLVAEYAAVPKFPTIPAIEESVMKKSKSDFRRQ